MRIRIITDCQNFLKGVCKDDKQHLNCLSSRSRYSDETLCGIAFQNNKNLFPHKIFIKHHNTVIFVYDKFKNCIFILSGVKYDSKEFIQILEENYREIDNFINNYGSIDKGEDILKINTYASEQGKNIYFAINENKRMRNNLLYHEVIDTKTIKSLINGKTYKLTDAEGR